MPSAFPPYYPSPALTRSFSLPLHSTRPSRPALRSILVNPESRPTAPPIRTPGPATDAPPPCSRNGYLPHGDRGGAWSPPAGVPTATGVGRGGEQYRQHIGHTHNGMVCPRSPRKSPFVNLFAERTFQGTYVTRIRRGLDEDEDGDARLRPTRLLCVSMV